MDLTEVTFHNVSDRVRLCVARQHLDNIYKLVQLRNATWYKEILLLLIRLNNWLFLVTILLRTCQHKLEPTQRNATIFVFLGRY